MLRTLRLIACVLLFVFAAPIASARVIDDFTVGPISLTNTLDAGYVRQTQTGLDPAHVVGGVRYWVYDVRDNFSDPANPDAAVRMGVAVPTTTGESGRFYYDADDRVTGVNCWLTYDADRVGLDIDLRSLGHNAIAFDVLSSSFEESNGHLDVLVEGREPSTRYGFMPLPNASTPYRLIMPLFSPSQPSLRSIKRVRLGSSNGVLFGDFELGRIETTNTADFNADGVVDGADFLVWQQNVGSTAPDFSNASGDADLNGFVNDLDLNFWRLATQSDAGVKSVPEPVSNLLLIVAMVAFSSVCRSRSSI